jgi:two-component system KDP operon response regulator KdpE
LSIVVFSRRSEFALGLDALRTATIVAAPPSDLSSKRAFEVAANVDAYVVDARDDEQHELVARLAMGGSQPVLVIASVAADEAVAYLDAGAADYVTEDTPDEELAARIRAAARRRALAVDDADGIRVGHLLVSIDRHEVRKGGSLVKLALGVWGTANASNRHSLRVYIRQLRKKLEADPATPAIIVSARGLGYLIK